MIFSGQQTTTRRQFVSRSALLTGGISLGLNSAAGNLAAETETAFSAYQQRRRADLWDLLGDLPWQHQPAPPKLVRTEEHDNYTLQRLVLDLNGIEPVPALLTIPKGLTRPAPGLLFIHWHAGMYGLGKEQLLKGTSVQPAYAPVFAEMGFVTLAIDSWCFGERQHDPDGHRGEEDAFELMLWRGQAARKWIRKGSVRPVCRWDPPRHGGSRRSIPGSDWPSTFAASPISIRLSPRTASAVTAFSILFHRC
jgi:hypothetical protein